MAHLLIVNGPGKWDLILSLMEGRTHNDQKKVTFLASKKEDAKGKSETTQVCVVVMSLQREDGGGSRFLFQGHSDKGAVVDGYIDTQSRKGWINIA